MKTLFLLKETMVQDRLGMMYLIGSLKKHGKAVDLLLTGRLNRDKLVQKVAAIKPDIIAVSTMTGEHNYYISLLDHLKRHLNFFSVMGGPHPTFSPEIALHKCVDTACIGEGEEAMVELVDRLEKRESVHDVANFVFSLNGTLKINPPRRLVDDLDEIPFPDRELIYSKDSLLKRDRKKFFFTLRGCPFRCAYCFNHLFRQIYRGKGRVIRTRSVTNFMQEVNEVNSTYPTELLNIYDDNFLLHDIEWLKEFAERLPRETGLPFTTNFNPVLVTEEKIQLLKKAGLSYAAIALETADDEVNKNILKRAPIRNHLEKTARLLHKYHIKFQVDCLIGLPVDDPLENAIRTMDFMIQIRPTFALSSILYPYPKTDIYNYVVEKGYYKPRETGTRGRVFTRNYSVLDFGDPKIDVKIARLHKLWGITISHPFILRRITRILINLPLLKLYTYVFWAWHGISYRFRLAVTSSSFRDLPLYAVRLLVFLRGVEKNDDQC
ncbi:MAG: radical SAM protein [bacterium]|nr:radical SAM protein [bacterium]